MHQLKVLAQREIRLINAVFMSHNVRARVSRQRALLTGQVFIYGLELAPGEKVDRVRGLSRELGEAISNQRGQETPVRFQTMPLALEVPNPQPVSTNWRKADWELQPAQMIAGRHYDLYARKAKQITLWLDRQYHVLVAGMTGAGKSVLTQMLLLSLAHNTSPDELEIWLVDLKNDDMTALRRLPHVTTVATNAQQAARVIGAVRKELAARQQLPGRWRGTRILLVIDEVAELRDMKEQISQLNSITGLGRSLRIHLLAATQKPTKDRMGGLDVDNFPARLVGAVIDARTASFITGRGGSGAEFLPNPGGFLYISGAEMKRFQSYHIPEEDIQPMVSEIRNRWPTVRRTVELPEPETPAENGDSGEDELPRLLETARPVLEEYWDAEAGALKRGGMAALIAALFGPHANTGGANRRRALQIVEAWHTREVAGV